MDAMDRLSMLMLGKGETQAHQFIHECGVKPIIHGCGFKYFLRLISKNAYPHKYRMFIPPKQEDRVLMFADKSGAYIMSDGFCTFLGSDISNEINQ